jgi:hypothetical protein
VVQDARDRFVAAVGSTRRPGRGARSRTATASALCHERVAAWARRGEAGAVEAVELGAQGVGAVTISELSWVNALARVRTAPVRATRNTRTDSTSPVRVFGVPDARPDAAARAAAYASIGSDLP